MLHEEQKLKLLNRLRRIEGQVKAVQRMVEEDADCVDVLMQISAAVGALQKSGSVVLENHLKTCVSEAVNSSCDDREAKLEELIQVFRKYSRS